MVGMRRSPRAILSHTRALLPGDVFLRQLTGKGKCELVAAASRSEMNEL